MMQFSSLGGERNGVYLEDLSWEVGNGEIYVLLCRTETGKFLFDCLQGISCAAKGSWRIDGELFRRDMDGSRVVLVDRIEKHGDFDSETSLRGWLLFACRVFSIPLAEVLRSLFEWSFAEKNLERKIRELRGEEFKMAYLALLLAGKASNLIFHDFAAGSNTEFEIFFNRLLLQRRGERQAILYITQDPFQAMKIADKVSFIKNGRLLPAAPIPALDLKEMSAMEMFEKFLS